MCQETEMMDNSCSAQQTLRQNILSGPALVVRDTQMEEMVTVLRVLQEHSMGASGTGQSEQLSGRTDTWKWSMAYPVKTT